MDFKKGEDCAIRESLRIHHIPCTPELPGLYSKINDGFWKRFEKGEISREQVLTGRFEELFREIGVDADPEAFEQTYQDLLGQQVFYVEGAVDLIRDLSSRYYLCVMTNGVSRTQYSRLKKNHFDQYFRHIFVWSGVWRQAGWGSIIYIATLAGVNPELHEAAIVDGANKLQRILKIDLPSILPTAVIMLIMNVGNIMGLGFEKAYLLQNDINIGVSEIISTYVYKVGIQSAQYSYSTAIGLFNNVINFVLLVTVNRVAKRLSGSSLW